MNVIMSLDGAPGSEFRMTPAEVKSVDPRKLIIRLENRLSGLESLRSRSLSEIDRLTTEAAHARDDITRPFPQAHQLAAARDGVLRLEEKLRETTAPSRATAMTACLQRPCPTQRLWQGFLVRLRSQPATRTASRNPQPRYRSVTFLWTTRLPGLHRQLAR